MSIVSKYMGATPTIITADIYKTTKEGVSGFESIHRDRLDFHTLSFIIYLCDVDAQGGATGYLKKSHTFEGMSDLLKTATGKVPSPDPLNYFQPYISSVFEESNAELLYRKVSDVFGDNLALLTGGAGDLNIFDSYGYHVGTNVHSAERLAVRVVFTLTPKIPFHKNDVLVNPDSVNSKEKLPIWMKYIHRIFLKY